MAATQIAEKAGKREVAGNFTYEMTLTFGACVRVERYAGLLAIEFDSLDNEPLSGRATIEGGRNDVLTTTAGCTSGPQAGQSSSWGMDPTPASGPKSNITFSSTSSNGGRDDGHVFSRVLERRHGDRHPEACPSH